MARHATIIGHTKDLWGDLWDVREARSTAHGFDLLMGWPHGVPRGRGGAGGPRIVVTPELARHMEAHRRSNLDELGLPAGRTAIKRLRRLLGHHRYHDARHWWEERLHDLEALTLAEFARKHGCTVTAAEWARLHYYGKRLREAGWWRQEPERSILLTWPTAAVCDALDLAPGSVRRLRSALKTA